MADWNLSSCCGTEETLFIVCFSLFFAINLALWNTAIMKPMKLIAVFIHEMGHATACWMTGGKVEGIEVYNNEGGVTKYRGGKRWFIIPAGYLGGAFWGGFFVVMSGMLLDYYPNMHVIGLPVQLANCQLILLAPFAPS
jgi:hypothetical protein